MNGFFTEPIILSGEESAAFFDSLRRPNKEYLNKRDEIFAEMDEKISIQRNGMDMEVDIPDLDLSFIDEMNNSKERELISNIKISAEYSFKAFNADVARELLERIIREKATIINNINNIILDLSDNCNKIVRDQCVFNESCGDKPEAYVKDKNCGDMIETCDTEQIIDAA